MKIASVTAAILLAASSTFALANGNSDNAKTMVQNIQTLGGSIAPTVSGTNAIAKGDSGWGNAGSRVTSGGAQVSKSGKPN